MAGKKKRYAAVAVILVLFALSVLIRLPALDRPLSNHHEYLTSHLLRNHDIWYAEGIEYYGFLPVMTYNNDADRNINNQGRIADAKGDYYYTSYPPFAYYLPYFVFLALGVAPAALPLTLFNMLLHLLNCCLVYLLVGFLTKTRTASVIGFSVYLFSPATLWFHSNVYFPDTLVQTFFILGIYLSLRYLYADSGNKHLLAAGINAFLFTYTEWLGLFFLAALFIYAAFNGRDRKVLSLLLVTALASMLAVAVTVVHYSQIDGFENFAKSFIEKYMSRSALDKDEYGDYTQLSSLPRILSHYAINFAPLILLLGFMAYLANRPRKGAGIMAAARERRPEFLAIYLSALPVLMHHLLGLNFTISHDFSVLKAAVFFSLAIALLYHSLAGHRKVVNAALVLALLASVGLYFYVNVVYGMYMAPHNEYKEIGLEIAGTAGEDEVVFIEKDGYVIDPQLVYYAHRNIAPWTDEESARQLIEKDSAEGGIVFVLSEDATEVTDSYRIGPGAGLLNSSD